MLASPQQSPVKRFVRRFSPRAWSNDELERACSFLPSGLAIVNVGGWRDLDKEGRRYRDYFREPSTYHVANHPGDHVRGGAVQSDLLLDLTIPLEEHLRGRYDVVFSHTVLEHVPDPIFAFAQLSALTRDLIITVVPFKQKLHFEAGMYGDYFRLTPWSLRGLHEANDFTVLYESCTPRPSLDVYLLALGSKHPERHTALPQRVFDLQTLHQQIGETSSLDLLLNVIARAINKYSA